MKFPIPRIAALALALTIGTGMAAAQTSGSLQLTDSQKATIYRSLQAPEAGTGEEVQPALTAGESFREGAVVPPDIELLEIPAATTAQVPAVRGYKYTSSAKALAWSIPTRAGLSLFSAEAGLAPAAGCVT